jgi:peptidoglycan-N-acetylglucosamine deacetylase
MLLSARLLVVATWPVLTTGLIASACSSTQDPQADTRLVQARQALSPQANAFVGTSLANKQLALTFDDGPGDRTAELSRYLRTENIRAAFFVNGARIVAPVGLPNPNNIPITANIQAILAQLVADGHLISNHTETHRNLATIPAGDLTAELAETDAAIANFTPPNRLLFRPPFGSWNSNIHAALAATPMNKYIGPVYWDTGGASNAYPNAAADWACWQGQLYAGAALANGNGYATTSQCGDAYLSEINAVGKGIVLLHDPYEYAGGSTVDMVKYIVPKLKAAGYTFVRVDEVPEIASKLPCDATCATCNGPNVTQCTTCAPGKFLSGGRCTTCSSCKPDEFAATACAPAADTICTRCSTCRPGQFLANACTRTVDTTCTTCPAGTFSAVADAPTCSACPDCDDKDLCTTDVCDRVQACTHAMIAGCMQAVDAGPDSSTIDAGEPPVDAGTSPTDGATLDGGMMEADAEPVADAARGDAAADAGAKPAPRSRGCSVYAAPVGADRSHAHAILFGAAAFVWLNLRRRRATSNHAASNRAA